MPKTVIVPPGTGVSIGEVAEAQGIAGILLTFDDFVRGMEDVETRIQPPMTCRRRVAVTG